MEVEVGDAKELLADHIKVEHTAAVVAPPATGVAAGCKPDRMTRHVRDHMEGFWPGVLSTMTGTASESVGALAGSARILIGTTRKKRLMTR